ncbi:MAG TPA: hypothetical protein VLG47_00995 [Candidatus Saccharimonadales bacterium]|nr:hypothetical protein [Candidatus Saccharimonadales bacterium]
MPNDEHVPENLKDYFRKNKDGSVAIIDIVSKKAATPGEIPDFINSSQYYTNGLKKIKKFSDRVEIDVWLVRHQKTVDLGQPGAFRQALEDNNVYIPEGKYWSKEEVEIWNDASQKTKPKNEAAINAMIQNMTTKVDDGFTRTQCLAVAGSKVRVEFVDYTFYDFKDTPGLSQFDEGHRAFQRNPNHDRMEAFYWRAALTYYREWIMISNLGYVIDSWLAKSSGSKPLKILMTIGMFHNDLIRKLQSFGIDAKTTYPRSSDEEINTMRKEAEIIAKYRYTPDDISLYRGLNEIIFR